jgi:hypothetical protein
MSVIYLNDNGISGYSDEKERQQGRRADLGFELVHPADKKPS